MGKRGVFSEDEYLDSQIIARRRISLPLQEAYTYIAVLMQTDVNAVAESAVEGQEAEGMMRKLGTKSLNQGVVEQSSESHWPVAVSASLVRLRTRVSRGV
jgi:hypothetical protein